MKKVVFLRKIAVLVLIGVFAFAMWYFEVGCLIKRFLKIPCLTCGMTRAFFAFINGDFASSWSFHPMLWSVPVLAVMYLFSDKLFKGKIRVPATILLVAIGLGFIINYVFNMVTYFN